MMERVAKQELRMLGVDKRIYIRRNNKLFVITVHFQYRLKTRANDFITVDEVIDAVEALIRIYESMGVLNKKIPVGATFKVSYCGVSIKAKRVAKNVYVLCTAIIPSLQKAMPILVS